MTSVDDEHGRRRLQPGDGAIEWLPRPDAGEESGGEGGEGGAGGGGGRGARGAGPAGGRPFVTGPPPRRGKALAVADRDDAVDDRRVVGGRPKILADALHQIRATRAARVHRT